MKVPTESQEQKAVIKWFNLQYPEFKGRLVASANGAHLAGNTKQRAMKMNKMKSEGFSSGFPDLHLPIPRGGYHGLFIEMKREKGGVLSAEQKDWIYFLNTQGHAANVCRGAFEAIESITRYMESVLCGTCWLEYGKPECQGNHATDSGYG